MKRIAVIQDGYVRDAQVFIEDPAIIKEESDWENHFTDLKCPCQFIRIFEGETDDEIKTKAACCEGVHPGVITLIEI